MSGPTLLDSLRKTEIFGEMSPEELNALLRVLGRRKVAQGGVLYGQGEPGDSLAIVAYGGFSIEYRPAGKAPIQVGLLGVGDVVGELSCVDPAPRSATVRAMRESGVLELNSAMLRTIQEKYPKIGARIIGGISSLICGRIRETNEKVVRIVHDLLEARNVRVCSRKACQHAEASGQHLVETYPVCSPTPLPSGIERFATPLQRGRCSNTERRGGPLRRGRPGDSAYFLTAGHPMFLDGLGFTETPRNHSDGRCGRATGLVDHGSALQPFERGGLFESWA